MVCVFSLYLLFYFYLIFLIIFRTVYVFVHLNFQVALKCTDSYNSSRKIQLAMKIVETMILLRIEIYIRLRDHMYILEINIKVRNLRNYKIIKI